MDWRMGAVWLICGVATAGVIARPFRWPEAIWAAGGALLLVLLGLMPVGAALGAVGKGLDVYLFLIGMMLLSETAREHGLFDWVAATAAIHAGGSPARLFLLVYLAGIVITTFLSNDATAVVLTPAVFAAARKARADPLPALFACALVANAASFVLPISNPANLVLYGGAMPPLGQWFGSFALPSLAAIAVTFAMLRWAERRRLAGHCVSDLTREPLSRCGKAAMAGIGATAVLLMIMSATDRPWAGRPVLPVWPRRWWSAGWRGNHQPGLYAAWPGACCRWSPGCSCWSRLWTALAASPLSPAPWAAPPLIRHGLRRFRGPSWLSRPI
jgi:arsenical pump membrane protein